MPSYTFIITLYDSGLSYPDRETALKAAETQAEGIADSAEYNIKDVQVEEEVYE
jgi:hypothetical protein